MKNVEAKVFEMLKERGINATEAQVKAAFEKATAGKQELGKDALDKVAGGFDPTILTTLLPVILDVLKGLGLGGGKDDDKGGDPSNTQDNSGNTGIQQNNQTGNNSNTGGMSQTTKSSGDK